MIRGSMRVKASYSVEQVVSGVGVHLFTDMKVNVSYKNVQLMRTVSRQPLVELHGVMSREVVVA